MPPEKILQRILELTGALMPESESDLQRIRTVQEGIARVLAGGGEVSSRVFRFEQSNEYQAKWDEQLEDPALKQIVTNALISGGQPGLRICRRDVPDHGFLPGDAVPAWARGAAKSPTEGPFRSSDGREIWFDFYDAAPQPYAEIYYPDSSRPVAFFSALPSPPTAPFIQLTPNSTIWLKANKLDATLPEDDYIGFQVRHPSRMSVQGVFNLNAQLPKIFIGAAQTITFNLVLASPPPTPMAGEGAAEDGRQVTLSFPSGLVVSVKQNKATIQVTGNGACTAFGDSRIFTPLNNQPSWYEPALKRIVLPFSTDASTFRIRECHSDFNRLEGEAAVLKAGWAFPVTKFGETWQPRAVEPGGWALQCGAGISALIPGPGNIRLNLPNPWIVSEPGKIYLAAEAVTHPTGEQQFRLWADEPGRWNACRVQLNRPFRYYFASVGAEHNSEWVAFENVQNTFLNDKPLQSTGLPFQVRSERSTVLMARIPERPDMWYCMGNEPEPAEHDLPMRSLSLHNAFLTVSENINHALFAKMAQPDQLDEGVLHLDFYLKSIMPIAPDPYAANYLKQTGGRPKSGFLTAAIAWIKEEHTDAPSILQFYVTPPSLPGQPGNAQEWDRLLALFPASKENETEFFNGFEDADRLRLLDVSSNADWLGLAYSIPSPWQEDYLLDGFLHAEHLVKTHAVRPYQLDLMELKTHGKFARTLIPPQISWEPMLNLNDKKITPNPNLDPPKGLLFFENDGDPTQIFNNTVELTALTPLDVANSILEKYDTRQDGFTLAKFTLPFGLKAFARFAQKNHFSASEPPTTGTIINWERPEFDGNIKGGHQIAVLAPYNKTNEHKAFRGKTIQSKLTNGTSPLGSSVHSIFEERFGSYEDTGVPLERISFSGYGASIFSHWVNKNAGFGDISQALFDVFRGRTANEVIQAKSIIYPWGIRVVRTIKMYREPNGLVLRTDSGWKAESDGIFDFRLNDGVPVNPYEIHPGLLKGVFNVKNITEEVPGFSEYTKASSVLKPVLFSADVEIVPTNPNREGFRKESRDILGFVQLEVIPGDPNGTLPPDDFKKFLNDFQSIGGAIDCIIDIGGSGQRVQLQRFEVATGIENTSTGVKKTFWGVVRGAPILPPDGSWTIVALNGDAVAPLPGHSAVPFTREGILKNVAQKLEVSEPNTKIKMAPPPGKPEKVAILQSMDVQKVLFPEPYFKEGEKKIFFSDTPKYADAFSLLNTKSIFPDIGQASSDLTQLNNLDITKSGFDLLVEGITEEQNFIEADFLNKKLYLAGDENADFSLWVKYETERKTIRDESVEKATLIGKVKYTLHSSAAETADKWKGESSQATIGLNLGSFKPLFTIKGKLDAQKGQLPEFKDFEFEFGYKLKPIKQIISILTALSAGQYKDALEEGLKVAFSNSAGSGWDYKLAISQDFPLLRYPPPAYDNPAMGVRIELVFKLGCYFNGFVTKPGSNMPVPVAGAFVELNGTMSVLLVSIGIAGVYATGSITLRLSVDTFGEPGFLVKIATGAQVMVGLPVVGNVFLDYRLSFSVDSSEGLDSVTGGIMYKGAIELFAGLLCVGVSMEAQGGIIQAEDSKDIDIQAKVTFGLHASLFMVGKINVKESFEEKRLIGSLLSASEKLF